MSLAPPPLSSTYIANRTERKSVNYIFDSDEDDDLIEIPSTVEVTRQKIKPSPNVKNKSKPQQQRRIEDMLEKRRHTRKVLKALRL